MRIKKLAKSVIFEMLRYSCIPFVLKKFYQSKGVPIFLFHSIDEHEFVKIYTTLEKHYTIISLDDCVKYVAGESVQLPKNPAVITFDDARVGNLDLLKFSEYMKPKPYVFASTADSRLDGKKYVAKTDLIRLKKIFKFGGHTISHPKLPFLSESEQVHEIVAGKVQLEEIVNTKISYFAYPYGLYSNETLKIVENSSYDCALTVDFGINCPGENLYKLKRICLNEDMSESELIVKSSGLWNILFKRKSANRKVTI